MFWLHSICWLHSMRLDCLLDVVVFFDVLDVLYDLATLVFWLAIWFLMTFWCILEVPCCLLCCFILFLCCIEAREGKRSARLATPKACSVSDVSFWCAHQWIRFAIWIFIFQCTLCISRWVWIRAFLRFDFLCCWCISCVTLIALLICCLCNARLLVLCWAFVLCCALFWLIIFFFR